MSSAPDAAGDVRAAVEAACATQSARIVSSIVRATGDWDLAEDCLQDAFARALASWPDHGIPANPGAWLTAVAKNRSVDILRRRAAERRALDGVAYQSRLDQLEEEPVPAADEGSDDQLSLIFACCHPALPMDTRVALTLRAVAGLGVDAIARSFLVTEATMAKRLVRARARIKSAQVPFSVPPPTQFAQRASGVHAVLYLLFNEGYASTEGASLVNPDLEAEAIRLARLMAQLIGAGPRGRETRSLLALMLLHRSRDQARTDSAGRLVPLEDQDRSLWDQDEIAQGVSLVNEVTRGIPEDAQPGGPYYLQASIAACHAVADSFAATDFARIAVLYAALADAMPSPVVELNRAAAVAMASGPAAGLRLLDELGLSRELDGYYLLHATRADLLRRLGLTAQAADSYRRAASLAPSQAERDYLNGRLAAIRPQLS